MEIRARKPEHWRAVLKVCRQVAEAGGTAHLVGGGVRDALLGLEVVDFDLEVFGLAPERVREVLERDYAVDLVGESFGVIKLRHLPIDVSLPRREAKVGLGHRAFEVLSDPQMSVREAAARRDFTINSMAWDPLAEILHDPFGGAEDLGRRILRHTSERFSEDPLRVLRGMQFVARFALTAVPETLALCRSMELEGLARERIFEEWRKLVLRGTAIARGLGFLRDSGWVGYFPELAALIDCPQDRLWHPEGDVWVHTGHVMDAFAEERIGEEWEDLVVGLGCLCHDFGKPATTLLVAERWRSAGHEEAGIQPTRAFLSRLTDQERLAIDVVPLAAHHLKPRQLFEARSSDAAVRRLARKVGRIDRLVRVARADAKGRPPEPFDGFPAGDWLLGRAEALSVSDRAPQALIMGRHLRERGLQPGPAYRPVLEECFEAQLDGRFQDLEGGLAYLDEVLTRRSMKA